jgi:hypothetical protein
LKTLLAGPWIGEFGWELFKWQAFVRNKALEFDETIVITRKGNEFLYKDFCSKFMNFDSPLINCCGPTNKDLKFYKAMNKFNNIECDFHFKPDINGKINEDKKFVSYKKDIKKDNKIVIHARHFPSYKNNKNWSEEKWIKLDQELKMMGFEVVFIGIENVAYFPEKSKRFLNSSLEDLSVLISSSKLIIGPSSGPIHFASLCECPQITWGNFDSVFDRYERAWNPFGVDVDVIGKTWNPSIKDILNKVEKYV